MLPAVVKVILENSELVHELQAELASKEAELTELQARLNRAEYLYGCECHVTGELLDLCRAHGIQTRFTKRR